MSAATAKKLNSNVEVVGITVDYNPHPKQVLFHLSDADECVFGGAKGGGKSCSLAMDGYAYASTYAGSKIYLFRQTYDELEANVIDEIKNRIPEKTKHNPTGLYVYDTQKHIFRLLNGSRIFCRYVRNKQDARKYNGREMDYCGVDELTQHEEETIQILRSCVRSPKGFPARFRASCNPGDVGHVHVKKRYITPTIKGQKTYIDPETGNKIEFVPSRVEDNPTIMMNDPAYVRRLNSLPPSLRKAYKEGDWDIFEGQAFEEWNSTIHVCKSFPIPKHWRKWRSCDNGYTDPFAWYWFAVDEGSRVHIYREYTRDYEDSKLIYSDQAAKVLELSTYTNIADGELVSYKERCDFTILGHDAWSVHPLSINPQQPKGKAIIDYYYDAGLTGFVKAITDRRLRKAVWHEYLKPYLDENDKNEENPDGTWKAKVVIHDCCKKLIETLPQQIYDKEDHEKVAETDYDHWYDGAGYGLIAYHVERSKAPKEEKTELQKYKEKMAKARQPRRLT